MSDTLTAPTCGSAFRYSIWGTMLAAVSVTPNITGAPLAVFSSPIAVVSSSSWATVTETVPPSEITRRPTWASAFKASRSADRAAAVSVTCTVARVWPSTKDSSDRAAASRVSWAAEASTNPPPDAPLSVTTMESRPVLA